MDIYAILYLIATSGQIVAAIPQIVKLYQSKKTDEVSLLTWLFWSVAQLAVLAYVISREEVLMTIISTAWVGVYGSMAALIIKYKYFPAKANEKSAQAVYDSSKITQ